MRTTNGQRLRLKLEQHCNNQQSTTRAPEYIGHQRSVRLDRRLVMLRLASIPSSPRRVARRCRTSGLPAPSRYFIFTLLSLFLSYIFGLMGLRLSLSLKTEIMKLELRLSLSLWSLKFGLIGLALLYNFINICPCFDFIRWCWCWWAIEFVFSCIVICDCEFIWLALVIRGHKACLTVC